MFDDVKRGELTICANCDRTRTLSHLRADDRFSTVEVVRGARANVPKTDHGKGLLGAALPEFVVLGETRVKDVGVAGVDEAA